MAANINETHDADARSWVVGANEADSDFPLQNLPFGAFRTVAGEGPRLGVRIGESIFDLRAALDSGVIGFDAHAEDALRQTTLNAWMALGTSVSSRLRHTLFELLHARNEGAARERVATCLVDAHACEMMLPATIGDFTDFYTSIHHARRASEAIRGDATLHPNFRTIPVAYHGRSSSVTVSGSPCHRPYGTTSATSGYQPSEKLDFELEVGFYVGVGTESRKPFDVNAAEAHVFGFCLVNDWSARDLQRWESAPLGPFLAKSFMTSTSVWVVTTEALAPFRTAPPARGSDAPPLAAQMYSVRHAEFGAIDIALDVTLQTRRMRESGVEPVVIGRPDFRDQYWTPAQMVAHHASNGCPLRSGDLLSSGTVSGPLRANSGCLLERTNDGKQPIFLPGGESRGFLEDGDIVAFSGRCARDGFRSIGFGECIGEVVGAHS